MPSRATIVIPVWNQWTDTAACLASLRPTLRPGDEVVVVDNGSVDETPVELARRAEWVDVITNPTNRGFAAACNQGAAAAHNEIIVFLNNDTVLAPGWLDRLLEPFDEPNVGATGPRSNFVAGPQLVPHVDYDIADPASYHRWVDAWAVQAGDGLEPAQVLIGFCVAIRLGAFESVGGFDEGFGLGGYEDNDLSHRLADAGWALVIVHAAFVHHVGHQTFDGNGVNWFEIQESNRPLYERKRNSDAELLISGALIVRNEAHNLSRCLDALSGLVDEVVVYDTGSTDGTADLAREAGAVVIEGYWDDDFARARNAAMEHCRGRWVLSVDADEVAQADVALTRHFLRLDLPFDVLAVNIVNLSGTIEAHRPGIAHHMFRLLRRGRCQWQHRLHEQPRALAGQPDLRRGKIQGLELLHYGYLDDISGPLNKRDRNLRVSLQDLEDARGQVTPSQLAGKLINVGRSYVFNGLIPDAHVCYEEVRSLEGVDTPQLRIALRLGVETLLDMGRLDEADDWLAELRGISTDTAPIPAYLTAQLALRRNDADGAFAALEGVGELITEEGINFGEDLTLIARGHAFLGQGRYAEAIDALVLAAQRMGEPQWEPLLLAVQEGGGEIALAAGLASEQSLVAAAAALGKLRPATADAFLEALWPRFEGRPAMLAAVTWNSPRMGVQRCLQWSARLREFGVPELCPVRAIMISPFAVPLERLRAAGALVSLFAEAPNEVGVRLAASLLAEDDLGRAIAEMAQLAPELVPAVIAGAAGTAGRAVAVARALQELGAAEPAGVVLVEVFGHGDLDRAERQLAGVGD